MSKKIYQESDIIDLQEAMKKKADRILSMVTTIENEVTSNNFGLYDDFIKKIADFDTLSILVETRLQNIVPGSTLAGQMREQYNDLRIGVVHGQIKAGIKFLFVCTASNTLPLGSQNLFKEELRRLYRSQTEISLPKYKNQLDENVLQDMSLAELILQEIIEKAPSLLDFNAD
ncbi:MAG: hypothetical protein JKX94_11585 [Sneathiella sp.]|nr:hypothetical protein [Sneathiella sp.]